MTVTECAKLLGEAIAKDEAVLTFNTAKKAYEENEAITKAVNEYNAQRMILGQEFTKDSAMQDSVLIETLQKSISENYDFVMNSPEYKALTEAQEKVNALMQSVNSDINFYAFGERPCTHDCSSCSSNCSSRG